MPGPEKCLACVYDLVNGVRVRNYRYAEDGTDLTAEPIFNPNPLDIVVPSGRTVGDIVFNWNNFYSFIREIKDFNTTNPQLNSSDGRKTLTIKLLREYNNNEIWHNRYEFLRNLPLTQEDIEAIQAFTKITDPNVKIDGFLGTQTIQMFYPRSSVYLNKPLTQLTWETNNPGKAYPESEIRKLTSEQQKFYAPLEDTDFVARIWGNKRYVITYKQSQQASIDNFKKPFYNNYVLYDPVIHTPLIPRFIPGKWKELGEDATINPLPNLKNITTQRIQVQRAAEQNRTNLTNSLTNSNPR